MLTWSYDTPQRSSYRPVALRHQGEVITAGGRLRPPPWAPPAPPPPHNCDMLPSRLSALLHWGIKVKCDSRGERGWAKPATLGFPCSPSPPPPPIDCCVLPSRLAALLHWGIKVHCDSRGKGGGRSLGKLGSPCSPPPPIIVA